MGESMTNVRSHCVIRRPQGQTLLAVEPFVQFLIPSTFTEHSSGSSSARHLQPRKRKQNRQKRTKASHPSCCSGGAHSWTPKPTPLIHS